MSHADYFVRMVEAKGIGAAFSEACQHIRELEARANSLWETRFFEMRTLDGGRKKLVPVLVENISRQVDLQDLHDEPLPEFLYQEDDGTLHPLTFGATEWQPSDDERSVHGSGSMVANGKVVGYVQYTDH